MPAPPYHRLPPLLLGASTALLFGCQPAAGPPRVAATTGPTSKPAEAAPTTTAVPAASPLVATHGVMVGEVTSETAVLWSRTSELGSLWVQVEPSPAGGGRRLFSAPVLAERDLTARALLQGLRPGTTYAYAVWFTRQDDTALPTSEPPAHALRGRFKTAPAASASEPVTFVWGGDLGGHGACRDRERGYPIMAEIQKQAPDFFIGLGDMIYADHECLAISPFGNAQIPGPHAPATNLGEYWNHWKYNREDQPFQALLRTTSYYAVWDDHEVVNDFSPLSDTRDTPPYQPGVHLLPIGRQALWDYHPLLNAVDRPRMYRSVRWGKHVELLLLDTRSYRDDQGKADEPTAPKTLLGRAQRAWLIERLMTSSATWKFVVSSVAISSPSGRPGRRDGWANLGDNTGYEHELRSILNELNQANKQPGIWLTTDVHHAAAVRHRPFAQSPDFVLREYISGPLSAGVGETGELDQTFHPERLFGYPDKAPTPEGMEVSAEAPPPRIYERVLGLFNFGAIQIDAQGVLRLGIHTANGEVLYREQLESHP